MRIIDGFTLRSVAGEMIVSGESVAQINFNKLVSLNSTATFLWRALEGKEFDVPTVAALLVDEYEIDTARADADAKSIVDSWLSAGLIEE